MAVFRALCIVAGSAILSALPASTYAQSPELPAFELGGTFNGVLVVMEELSVGVEIAFAARRASRH